MRVPDPPWAAGAESGGPRQSDLGPGGCRPPPADPILSGIIDSYGLVNLLAEVEHKTGLEAEWHMAIPDGDTTDSPLFISINGLSRALVKGNA